MKKIINIIILIVMMITFNIFHKQIYAESNNSSVDEQAQIILNDFYNEGVYKKETIINLVDATKTEVQDMFHASCNNLDRITYYNGEELWMTNLSNTINSGYETVGSDMKHFTRVNEENIYDYTVKNTKVTEYYQTLKNLKETTGWQVFENNKYINYNENVVNQFREFVAPLWLDTPNAKHYIVLTSIIFYVFEDELHFELMTSSTDSSKINNTKGIFAKAVVTNELRVYSDGKHNLIKFGSYPQTHVSDDVLINELNALSNINERGYYEYNGVEYAKVLTTPSCYGFHDYYNLNYTYSTGKIVEKGVTEWFKVEPIVWRILSNTNGTYHVLSEYILDASIYYKNTANRIIDNKTVYANNYKYSTIREFINDKFYYSAFKENEQSLILTTEVDNSSKTAYEGSTKFACDNTFDKIYLLSYKDMVNPSYGFSGSRYQDDEEKQAIVSDYAKAVGSSWSLDDTFFGKGNWWLRSPYYWDLYTAQYSTYVNYSGDLNSYVTVYFSVGVRPSATLAIQ